MTIEEWKTILEKRFYEKSGINFKVMPHKDLLDHQFKVELSIMMISPCRDYPNIEEDVDMLIIEMAIALENILDIIKSNYV